MSWSFLVVPVGAGALLLAVFAYAWHNLVTRWKIGPEAWPIRRW